MLDSAITDIIEGINQFLLRKTLDNAMCRWLRHMMRPFNFLERHALEHEASHLLRGSGKLRQDFGQVSHLVPPFVAQVPAEADEVVPCLL